MIRPIEKISKIQDKPEERNLFYSPEEKQIIEEDFSGMLKISIRENRVKREYKQVENDELERLEAIGV